MKKSKNQDTSGAYSPVTRREVMASGAAIAAASVALTSGKAVAGSHRSGSKGRGSNPPKPPFDSMRDYVEALDYYGLLRRFSGVDQDRYEATAIMYQLVDTFGVHGAPAVMFEDITANGQTFSGPVVSNLQGHWDTEAILWDLPRDPYDPTAAYRAAKQIHLENLENNDGAYALIDPVEVSERDAPVKAVKKTGDEVDVTAFPFLRGNPGDGGPYINTGSVITKGTVSSSPRPS